MRPLALYLHIPYCLSRCHYCDFNTYVLDGAQSREYVRALAGEIRHQGAVLEEPGVQGLDAQAHPVEPPPAEGGEDLDRHGLRVDLQRDL
ncbi:MAG: hypothetical protein HY576_00360, partial [candidate division NC10 bacterium]|nr:hypothetical protein [candidate division NC10 bacterium]